MERGDGGGRRTSGYEYIVLSSRLSVRDRLLLYRLSIARTSHPQRDQRPHPYHPSIMRFMSPCLSLFARSSCCLRCRARRVNVVVLCVHASPRSAVARCSCARCFARARLSAARMLLRAALGDLDLGATSWCALSFPLFFHVCGHGNPLGARCAADQPSVTGAAAVVGRSAPSVFVCFLRRYVNHCVCAFLS